jgi:hypothetical protein
MPVTVPTEHVFGAAPQAPLKFSAAKERDGDDRPDMNKASKKAQSAENSFLRARFMGHL